MKSLYTFVDLQLLSAMNHHLSLAEWNVRLPMQRYFAWSLFSRITWHSAGWNAEVKLIIWLFSISRRDSRSSQLYNKSAALLIQIFPIQINFKEINLWKFSDVGSFLIN